MGDVESDRLRLEGNEFFKAGKFEKAIDAYSAAIAASPSAALYCNRAFCNVKLCFSGEALNDVDEALKLDPANVKAHYRAGQALLQLGKVKEALREFKACATLAPADPDAAEKVKIVEKQWKVIQFQKAIQSEETVPLSQKLDPTKIEVPGAYKGPLLGSDLTVTPSYVKELLDHMRAEQLPARRDVVAILKQAIDVMSTCPNVMPIDVPENEEITVCGDTHGQYYDLLNIFKLNGLPSEGNRYLFNGDFVDRGSYSFETIFALLAHKVLYPGHMYMSRGNHESLNLNRMYGFEGEVKAKYDEQIFQLFQEVFGALPLAHCINKKVFVTHGGLFSRDNVTIAEINKEDRFRDLPEEGLMVDMLWSDPHGMPGRAKNKRGVGVAFGEDITRNFLETNNLKLVVRSHEVTDNGYLMWHSDKLITVFSAPNYCDQIGNKGAFIRFEGKAMKPQFTTFEHVKHPGKRPMQYSAMGMGLMGM